MEAELVAMAADLFGTVPKAGTLSSGGTESIFLAVHTARSVGDQRGIVAPNIVTADTVHPAFAKACHYLRVEHRRVPVRADLRADPEAMAAVVDDDTVLLVGSAPCYPYGVIDPIPEIAAVASGHGTLCHVDACLGGWLLPWWERLGEPVAPWDFRVPGVTSLSADLHKYGYAFKGASLVLYRDPALVQHQWFVYDEWPGGLYGSITTAGTRPAAPIAGAWAAVRFLGAEGYLRKAAQVRDATAAFRQAVESHAGLAVTGSPDMSLFEFGATPHSGLDIGGVGDVLDERGWNLDRQPGGLHLMVSPYHVHVVEDFGRDLADAVAHHGRSRGRAAGYGGIADA
jgi:glutamate/tyrosine decarboxylase-like PLP-dependent enzyme